jgi:transmembrane sensor
MSAVDILYRLRHALGYYPTTAREWAVRVQSENVTRGELLALDEWLKADPRNADAYARVNKISHLGLMLRDHPTERANLNTYRHAPEGSGPRRIYKARTSWIPRFALAGAAVVVVLGTVVLMMPNLAPWSNRYVAAKGEMRQVSLDDGSRMLVNTDSEVKVRYGDRERVIDLVRGEAYFEVAKDPARPFIVRTDDARVRAVGTKFTVRYLVSATEVLVTEGRVEVVRDAPASNPTAVELAPGNRAVVSESQAAPVVAMVDVARATAWTAGKVEFDEATLADVIRDVNRYSTKEFVIADPSLEAIRLTGRFRVGDTDSVRFALSSRFDIVATEDNGLIRLSRAR